MRTLALTIFFTLVLAVPAFAGDNGEGILGETDDKTVTLFALGVLGFFTLVVIVGSVIQHLLDKRKEEHKAVSRLRQRTGW
jgi:hypothetical protein